MIEIFIRDDRIEEKGPNESLFSSDDLLYPASVMKYARFNRNDIRGSKPHYYTPIFVDETTPRPFVEDLTVHSNLDAKKKEYQARSKPNEIYMDHDTFAFGACALQVSIS